MTPGDNWALYFSEQRASGEARHARRQAAFRQEQASIQKRGLLIDYVNACCQRDALEAQLQVLLAVIKGIRPEAMASIQRTLRAHGEATAEESMQAWRAREDELQAWIES